MKDLFETKGKRGINKVAMICAVFMIAVVLILALKPTMTGFVIFSQEAYTWDFSNPAGYSYDANFVNFTAGAVSLNLQTNTTTTTTINEVTLVVISAMEGANNRTPKVIAQGDGNSAQIELANQFDVTFNSTVSNGDVVKMYLKGGYKSNVTLCDAGTQCGSPGQYGIVLYPASSQGYYYITVSGLSSPVSTLAFDTVEKMVEFDYIAVLHNITTTTTTTTTYYPSSAAIETSDLTIGNLSYWDIFTATETLNGQTIDYEYSTDSGNTWASVLSGNNLSSADTSSGKIRLKATLNSDGNQTPVLNNLRITYQTQFSCTESWSCSEWSSCSENSTQTRTCTDSSACGTTENKPAEIQSCTYTPPCTENWGCTEWDACSENGTHGRTCTDSNSCGTVLDKPNETQNCTYTPPCIENWSCGNWGSCAENGTQTRTCSDLNSCGTVLDKPNESQICTYIPPSLPCTENWTCTEWGSCLANGTQIRTCSDANLCNTTLSRPNETQNCTYTPPQQQSPAPSGGSTGTGGIGSGGSAGGTGTAANTQQKKTVPEKTEQQQIQEQPKEIGAEQPALTTAQNEQEGQTKADLENNKKALTGYAIFIRNLNVIFAVGVIATMAGLYLLIRLKKIK